MLVMGAKVAMNDEEAAFSWGQLLGWTAEQLLVARNECILAGWIYTVHFIDHLLKEKQNATDIAVNVQPLRTDVDGS